MYKHFFGLRENPFNVNPDPRYLFLTPQTQKALDELTYGIHARKGLMLLTGEVGTGKTTLINRLLDWLHQQRTPTAFIFNSHLETSHLFDFILADFGVPFDSGLKGNALMCLNQWLIERYRAGETPVLVLDEAQGLSAHVLEDIRLLLNLESPREKLLQIVLSGQPELEERLKQPELRQIKQRITLRYRTAALTLKQTHDYIQARLHIAGANGTRVFAPEAIDAVYSYSCGIPRVMNLLCEHALINAYADQVKPVSVHIVAEVAREYQFDNVKPVAFPPDFGEPLTADLILGQSTVACTPIDPPRAAEPPDCQARDDDSALAVSAPSVFADALGGPANRPATPVLNCETIADGEEANETSRSVDVPAAALAKPKPLPIDACQSLLRATAGSDARSQLIAELAIESVPAAFSSLLHVVRATEKSDPLLASRRSRVSHLDGRTYPTPKVIGKKSTPLFPATPRPAWNRLAVTLLGDLKRPFDSVWALFRAWPGWWGDVSSMVTSSKWPRKKALLYLWLQQPVDPKQWLPPYPRQFKGRDKFSQKKV